MKFLTAVIAVLLLMQSTARAEEPWRFITLADWHLAELYVQPNRFPGGVEQNVGGRGKSYRFVPEVCQTGARTGGAAT